VGIYWRLAVAGFRKQANYRLAMLAGLFTNVVFGFIRAAILLAALGSAGGTIAGYDQGQMSAYIWLSQGLLGAITLNGMAEIGDRIRSGDVAVDLSRPIDIQTWHLADELGRAVYTFIPRGLPSVLVGALTFGLTMPTTALPYLLGAVSIMIGIAISFYCRFAINILGFWFVDTRGVRVFYMVTSSFLAGLYVPVALFPDWLHTLAYATPFPAILQIPVDVISGRETGAAAFALVAQQVGWLIVTCLVGRLLMAAGRRYLVVQGG
jgi:ABC-2 type transport system permease protein